MCAPQFWNVRHTSFINLLTASGFWQTPAKYKDSPLWRKFSSKYVLKNSLRILSEPAYYLSLVKPSLIITVRDKSKSLRQKIGATTSSNKCIKSDLQVFRMVPSSWNNDKGIGPTKCAKIFSMFISSRTLERAKARRKIMLDYVLRIKKAMKETNLVKN